MAEKKIVESTQNVTEENEAVFVETLKKILETPEANRGAAARAIMSSFQVYYAMISPAALDATKQTR